MMIRMCGTIVTTEQMFTRSYWWHLGLSSATILSFIPSPRVTTHPPCFGCCFLLNRSEQLTSRILCHVWCVTLHSSLYIGSVSLNRNPVGSLRFFAFHHTLSTLCSLLSSHLERDSAQLQCTARVYQSPCCAKSHCTASRLLFSTLITHFVTADMYPYHIPHKP